MNRKHFSSFDGHPIPVVRSIYTDDNDRVWVAAGRHLYRAEPSGLNEVTILKADGSPFYFKQLKGIIKHTDGRFYLGIDNRVIRLVELEDRRLQIEYIYSKKSLGTVCFYTDHLGRVWCATTNKGVLLLDPSEDCDMIAFSKQNSHIFMTNAT